MKISDLTESRGKLGKNTHSILMRNRENRAAEKHTVKLVRLKKDGSESLMHDATSTYDTEDQARAKHAYWVKLNPGKDIRHNLYVDGKLVGILDTHTLQEMASSGSTGSASIATNVNPFGIVMKRPSLFGYQVPKKPHKRKKKSPGHK